MCLRCWRRILNTSRRLDWNTYTAPALQNYMERMMAARYNKNYRLGILKSALVIYYNKVEKDRDGTTLTNRPKLPSAPIIVPSNPNGELAPSLRAVVESEGVLGLQFKVVERGGRKLVNQQQKTNPTGSPGCTKDDCPVCSQP